MIARRDGESGTTTVPYRDDERVAGVDGPAHRGCLPGGENVTA